eukprot:14581759-Heterocapsa_arctica.AAC.1
MWTDAHQDHDRSSSGMGEHDQQRYSGGVHFGTGALRTDGQQRRFARNHGPGVFFGEQDPIQGQGRDQRGGGKGRRADHKHGLQHSDGKDPRKTGQPHRDHAQQDAGEQRQCQENEGNLRGTIERGDLSGGGRESQGCRETQEEPAGQGDQGKGGTTGDREGEGEK